MLAGVAFDYFKNYVVATVCLGASFAVAAALTWRLPRFLARR
jgi:hypothetical protein